MLPYERYKDLVGVPYDDGDRDCYGLARRFYESVYGLELPNYARSWMFFAQNIDIISLFLRDTDFSVVNVSPRNLEPGDGLIMSVSIRDWPKDRANHVGVYVGNGTILHHPLGKKSCEDYMTDVWAARILSVVRHPDIDQMNAGFLSSRRVNFSDLLPDHVKRKLAQ